MNEPEHESARMQGLDAAAHESFVLFGERQADTRAVLMNASRFAGRSGVAGWFQQEAARLRSALPGDSFRKSSISAAPRFRASMPSQSSI